MRLEEDTLHIQAAKCILHILNATHIKIIFNLDFFLFYVYNCFAFMPVYALHMCRAHRKQKRTSDPLGMEL